MSAPGQWLADPIVQSAVAPFLVAAILTGVLGFGLGKTIGPRIAAAAIPLGFLISYWATFGWPAFPPVSSNQKIVHIAFFGAVIGVLFDIFRRDSTLRRIGPAVWSLAIVYWLGWRLFVPPSLLGVALVVALWLPGAVILFTLGVHQKPGGGSVREGVMLLTAAIGVSLVALMGSSASLAQLSGGLAAATGGFLLWNWPKVRFPMGWAGLLGGVGALISLAAALVLFTNASKLALALIIPVFFADRLAARLPPAENPVLAPFILAAACLVPVALAVLIAYLSSGGGSGYAAGANMPVS